MDTQGQTNPAKMFVGNLPYRITEDDIRQAFSAFGTVTDVRLITDRATGRAKGFGFVEMSSADEANAAVEGMSGKDLQGRNIVVNIARPMAPRAPRPDFNRSY
jgi:RNA recognition motif-containing protein